MIVKKALTLLASMTLLAQLSVAAAWPNINNSPVPSRASLNHPIATQTTSSSDQLRELHQLPLSPDQLRLQPGYQNPDDAWLLTSPEFEHLSGAAQNYLLRKYGVLKPQSPESAPTPGTTERVTAAAAQTTPPSGDIKVNSPALDIGSKVQSETCSAAFGSNIVVGFNDSSGGGFSGLSYSRDNGASWTHTYIPAYPGGATLGDPVVAAGPNGEFYYATLAINQFGISSIGVTRLDDGGATWSPLVNASTTANSRQNFQDKEWMAVDATSSPHRGNVYVSWTSIQPPDRHILFARSTDGGRTWSTPIPLTTRNTFPQGSFIAVGPDGEVHVAWTDFGISGIRVVKSTDGGVTFSRPFVVAARIPNLVLTPLNGGFFSATTFPSVAVDTSDGPNHGHVYIVFNARGQGRDAADVFLVKSTDGGRRWSPPVRVNDDATDTDQWMPSCAVARTGTLAIMWYDRRNDPINNSLIDVYMTTSTDDGTTFAPGQRVTTGNWMLVPTPLDLRSGYHGDYNQMSISDTHFVFNWGDDREGNADVFVGFAPVMGRSASPDFNVSSKTLLRNIIAGQTAEFTIGSAGLIAFSDAVSLSASPTYPGLQCSFSSASITPGSDTTLIVETDATATPGTYLITIAGSSGGLVRTTNLRLTVYSGNGVQQPPNLISSTREGAGFASVAIDSAGTIHVAWRELDRSAAPVQGAIRRTVLYSQLRSDMPTFSSPIRLSDLEVSATVPVLKVDNAGNTIVLWDQTNPSTGFRDVHLSRSTDGGQTFLAPVNVSRTNSSQVVAFNPTLALDAAGTIYASWTRVDFNSQFEDIFVSRSTDGGQTFSDAVNVSQTNKADLAAFVSAVAVDGAGNVNVLWTQLDFNSFFEDVFFSRSTDGGQKFSAPVNLSQTNDFDKAAFSPVVATNQAGAIIAVWTNFDFDIGEAEIFSSISTDGGQTFSKPVNVSQTNRIGGSVSGAAAMAVDEAGKISIVWTDISPNNFEIFHSQSTDGGRSFSTPVNVSGNVGLSSNPRIAVGSGNRIVIAWNDDNDGIGNVFLSIGS